MNLVKEQLNEVQNFKRGENPYEKLGLGKIQALQDILLKHFSIDSKIDGDELTHYSTNDYKSWTDLTIKFIDGNYSLTIEQEGEEPYTEENYTLVDIVETIIGYEFNTDELIDPDYEIAKWTKIKNGLLAVSKI